MYKTIVVHVDGSAEQETRLRVAARLASMHGAHLVGSASTGISWLDYAMLTGSMGAPMMPEADFKGVREAVQARLAQFEEAARQLGVTSFEARMIEDDARNAMVLESRYADLVVLSRDADSVPVPGLATPVRGLPEYVAMHGVRPVLVLPPVWPDVALPGPTIIGWNGSVQAIRAITAALPLLRQASSVTLALINPDTVGNLHGDEPGADMALYLTRHGIKLEVVVERTRSSTADVLMGMARERGASMLVMGAFGHSRAREIVLGGVTRTLLATTPIPLLIAH